MRRQRPVRLTKTVATYVPQETYTAIDTICSDRDITLSTFLRELIDNYLATLA